MSKSKSKIQYESGKIKGMIAFIAEMHKIDEGYLRAQVYANFPELKDHTRCANYSASMRSYIYTLDSLNANLLLDMGAEVFDKIKKGIAFQEANKIHIQTLKSSYQVKSRTTWCSKLGLITKVMTKSEGGKVEHDRKAGWLITRRGFELLAGNKVPKHVVVFRNEIKERKEELTDIWEALGTKLYTANGDFSKLLEMISAGAIQGRML